MNAKYKLRFLSTFYDDLEEIVLYLCDQLDNPVAAESLVKQIDVAIYKRLNNPESYEKYVPSVYLQYPYYRIYVKNYVIYYVVKQDETEKIMEVRRILYAGRNRDKYI